VCRVPLFRVGQQASTQPTLPSTSDAQDSFLDEGFILDKKIGVGQPKRIENAKILVANTGAPEPRSHPPRECQLP
jgi:hypothetical protein